MADFYYFLNRAGVRGLPGVKGDPGDSPIITVQTETPNEYILKITNPDGTELISPNLRGNKININEGTYVRYNTETGELYTSTADGATGELAGVVRLATDVDITNMDERAVVTPSQLADALSKYLISPDGSVKIVQNAENSLTELTAKGGSSGELPIASADTLGGVKIGRNLSITEDGVLSSAAGGDILSSGDNTFTGTNDFNGAVNLNGLTIAENLTVTRNLTSSGEINAVSIKSTGIRSDDIKTTTNKKYLTEEDVDNQTIQIVEGKLHANLDELGNEVDSLSSEVTSLSGEVTDLSGRVTTNEADIATMKTSLSMKQTKLTAGANITLTDLTDGTVRIDATGGGGTGDIPIATTTTAGKVKPDGTTITITDDGTISAVGGSGGTTDYTQLENKPQINSIELTGNKTLDDLGIQAKGNYLTALPDNAVTTDTAQTISGDKTFTRSITTTDIFPAGEITFTKNSLYRYINNIDAISGGYRNQNGYLTFGGDTTLVGDNKLILNGRSGGLKLTADSTADITCENDLIAPNIRTTANGTIKLTHPTNTAAGLITLSNDYGQLSISSSGGGNNNLFGVVRGTAHALINGDNIETKDKDGNVHTYINTQNIDTTYMKWDSANKKLKVDTAAVAGLAMPSNRYIDLTLGKNETEYMAPANGWFYFLGGWANADAYFQMRSKQKSYNVQTINIVASGYNGLMLPITKGDSCIVGYSSTPSVIAFRFIYAEGSK